MFIHIYYRNYDTYNFSIIYWRACESCEDNLASMNKYYMVSPSSPLILFHSPILLLPLLSSPLITPLQAQPVGKPYLIEWGRRVNVWNQLMVEVYFHQHSGILFIYSSLLLFTLLYSPSCFFSFPFSPSFFVWSFCDTLLALQQPFTLSLALQSTSMPWLV